jgi:subtilase family serine protease
MTVTLSQAHWFFGCDDRTVVPISWLVESNDVPGHNPEAAYLQDNSGTLGKKMGLTVVSAKGDSGERTYSINS